MLHEEPVMRAFIVAVDYNDELKLCLPYNRHHFKSVTVITDLKHFATVVEICEPLGAVVLGTDCFYDDGAKFNKWKALEWGLDKCGRHGWLCLMDADVVWPQSANLNRILRPGFLYTPRRRMFPTVPTEVPYEGAWHAYRIHPNENEFAGYSQIFHGQDPVLGAAPWHQTDWIHAGGADSFFQAKWPGHLKVRPDWCCLHFGPSGTNWMGRVSPYANGTAPAGAQQRYEQLRGLLYQRRAKAGMERYSSERLPPKPPTTPPKQ